MVLLWIVAGITVGGVLGPLECEICNIPFSTWIASATVLDVFVAVFLTCLLANFILR